MAEHETWRPHRFAPNKYRGIYVPLPNIDYGSKRLVLCANFRGREPDDLWIQCKDDDMAMIAAAPELLMAIDDVVTQYPLIHPGPVPAWIRNAAYAAAKARGQETGG